MRICYIGGNAPLLLGLMEYMRDRGHEVHWISLDIPRYPIKGITVHDELNFFHNNIRKRNLFLLFYFIIFKLKIKRISPDILHAINVKWAGWFAVLSGFRPVIVTPQGGDVMLRRHYDRDFIRTWLRKHTLKNATVVTYLSNTILKDIMYWCVPKRVFRYFAGVDFRKYKLNPKSNELCKKLGVENRKVVFSPRMFEANSNLDIIIQTIPLVRKKNQNVIYIFSCHLEIKNYSETMKKLIAALDVEDSCLFIKNILPSQMVNYYSISDLVVSILSSDGIGTTLLETMAMKKTLIITNIPAYLELMNKNYALMVNPKDIEATADAIIRGLSNGKQLESMRKRAYEWVRENGNSRLLNDNIEKLYEELIS